MDQSQNPLSLVTSVRVMFYDTDCAGVVHNVAYLRIIEYARTLLAEKLGWKLTDLPETGITPAVVRTEINYRRPGRIGDTLVISAEITSIERSRFWCDFQIHRESDQELLTTCRQSLALVDIHSMRPVRLPADWATKFPSLFQKQPTS